MKTALPLRKNRQITIPKYLCEPLGLREKDVLELDIRKIPKSQPEVEMPISN